jgi:predicted TIM-barrel fold metal-dependent hydrolase
MTKIKRRLEMLIDAHTHVRMDELEHNVKGLIASMKKNGIDKAMVLANDPKFCNTEYVIKAAAPYGDAFYPIAMLSLVARRPSLRRFEEWLRTGQIYGAKFYPGYEYFYPGSPRFMKLFRPYLKLLAKYNRPAMFHAGDLLVDETTTKARLKYAHPLWIDDLATEMPYLKIVICHMGYPWVIDAAEVCYKNPSVWVDLSGFVYGKTGPDDYFKFQKFLGRFREVCGDPKKLIFGTDWPIADDHESYLYTLKALIPASEHELVFRGNAELVFGLK